MRPKLLKETIISLFDCQRTLCIEGPPGGGKTTIVHQAAHELDVPIIERHMPTMLVEDFGILFPSGEGSRKLQYHLPDWFPAKGDAPDKGILLFDDRNQANNDLQKVLANICQARNLHGVELPPGWMVISTGNRQSDRAGANRVLTHLRNRETVLELETHLDDWIKWALDSRIIPEIISFISFRPGLLHDFDPQRDQNPSPRTWAEGVSDIYGLVPRSSEYECFKGAVGEGAATEFLSFLKVSRELPDIKKFIESPKKSNIPSEPVAMYAMVGAVAYRANEDNMGKICKIASMFPAEYSVLMMSIIIKRDDSLGSHKDFTKWSLENYEILK